MKLVVAIISSEILIYLLFQKLFTPPIDYYLVPTQLCNLITGILIANSGISNCCTCTQFTWKRRKANQIDKNEEGQQSPTNKTKIKIWFKLNTHK